MKKTVITFLAVVLIMSCNSGAGGGSSPSPKESQSIIAAVYKDKNGGWTLDAMLRVIQKGVGYDSLNKKDVVTYDTVWGYPQYLPVLDSSGVQRLDSLGNKVIQKYWMRVGKDSVVWNVENKNLDSLVKTLK